MPKQDKTVCGVCNSAKFKYKCPNDQVPYCSVGCFKVHKEQADCPGTSRAKASNPMPPSSAAQEDRPIVTAPQPRAALKPLSELHWPLVDQDRLAVFSDPLRKDEILPIRQAEWEQIATSSSLRALLTNEPDLKHLLQRVLSAGQTTQPCVDNPNAAKDQIQQLLLQLAPSSQSPSLHSFSQQDFLLFNQFADIIRSILVKNRP